MAGNTKKPTVLAVDDDPVNLEVMAEVLDEHFSLHTASDGEQAIDLAIRLRPDVILLDLMMPGMDGYQTCQALRQAPGLIHTKILLVSARAAAQDRIEGYGAGADDYITKPFHPAELVAKIQVFLRLKSAEEINSLKGDLLNLVTHELRTPLTGLLPAAEILSSSEEISAADRRMWARMIGDCARRLHDWAEKGLVLCQLKSDGTASLDTRSFDLGEMLTTVLYQHEDLRLQGCLTLDTDYPLQLTVQGDAGRIRMVLDQVIENAFKHALHGSEVRLSLRDRGGELELYLHNDCRPRASLDPQTTFAFPSPKIVEGEVVGASIKMALCREILRAHQGEIELHWGSEGGATVRAHWPRQPATVGV